MTKQEMLDAFEQAEKVHLQQMQKIEDGMNGKHVDNPTALSKKECAFGSWFYANEKELRTILGSQLFDRLDKGHEEWHKEYLPIFNVLFKENTKTGLFSKIFGSGKIDTLALDKAKTYFVELHKASDELLKVIESARRRVSALPNTKFTTSV